MDVKSVVKVILVIAVILVAAPLVLNLLPEAPTQATVRSGFEKAGYTITNFSESNPPQLESVEQATFELAPPGGAAAGPMHVALYRFDNEGKLKKQYEYNKPDPGAGMAQAFVQTAGLGQTRQPTPVAAATNGKWLIVVTGPDKAAVQAAAAKFAAL